MSNYKKDPITIEEFAFLQKTGRLYVGFVAGLGYARVQKAAFQPLNFNGYSHIGNLPAEANKFVLIKGQCVDSSPEMIQESLKGTSIKAPQLYIVKQGDTFTLIAKKFGIQEGVIDRWIEYIALCNKVSNPNVLYVGQKLIIMPDQNITITLPSKSNDYMSYSQPEETNTYTFLDFAGNALTVEDVYNTFVHNHKTYKTTKGVVKTIYKANGAVRSARAAQFATASKVVKGAGVVGTTLMAGVAGANIIDDLKNDRSAEGKDIADFSVGVIGLSTTILVGVGIASNPVGWAIGGGVAIYGVGSAIYDLCTTDW